MPVFELSILDKSMKPVVTTLDVIMHGVDVVGAEVGAEEGGADSELDV
jgi:hypothetical protein